MAIYPSNQTKPRKNANGYLWNWLSSSLKEFKVYLQGYRCYKAALVQIGNNPPVATVLDNSLNLSVEYQYVSDGEYVGVIDQFFFANGHETITGKKLEMFISPSSSALNLLASDVSIMYGAYPIFFTAFSINSYNATTDAFENEWLGNFNPTILEIRVYN